MDYRNIGVSQLEQLWQLHVAYKDAIGEGEPSGEDKERLKLAMEQERILFYGAWDGKELAGCCSVTVGFSTFNYLPSGVFEDFYIVPEYRHRGIAGKLAAYAFRESGIGSMTVGCADCDAGMYRAIGFRIPLGNLLAYDPSENAGSASV